MDGSSGGQSGPTSGGGGSGPPRGGPRGRGGYDRGRGGFDRGRGRGMARGGMMGMRGGMGGPPMMRGRGGMGFPRGGPPRGMGMPRGPPRGGPPMRGSGRPPAHNIQLTATTTASTEDKQTPAGNGTTANGSSSVPSSIQSTNGGPHRGAPRGRGVPQMNRGRNNYSQSNQGDPNKILTKPYGMNRSNSMGGISQRGSRGGYQGGPPRPPAPHSANTQIAAIPTLKRGAPTGPPGPKRGRYDSGPIRPSIKHSQQMHHQPHYSQQSYQPHDQMQHVEYSQSYVSQAPPSSYNGYNQSAYGQQTTSGYGQDYDPNQYQSYGTSASYGQTDTRYQGYTQDYSQSYGTTVDYNAPPPDYSQTSGTSYDDRTYGYDAQAYQQGYTNASGYY